MENFDRNKGRAVLLGRLIRSYRTDTIRSGRSLTQEGLIRLIAERAPRYAHGFDRSSISRWETGGRLAPREFLLAFGRALRLSEQEVEGMLVLAGYDTHGDCHECAETLAAARRIEHKIDELQRSIQNLPPLPRASQ